MMISVVGSGIIERQSIEKKFLAGVVNIVLEEDEAHVWPC